VEKLVEWLAAGKMPKGKGWWGKSQHSGFWPLRLWIVTS